jgi:HK97 family phage prohead protease
MPTPHPGSETKEEFLDRCIPMMVEEGRPQDQAVAACSSMWEEAKGMRRAYSLFEAKSFDEERREIEGIATTPSADRLGDIIEPRGAKFSLPLPLLWQHMASAPVGHVVAANVTADGIRVRAKLAKTDEPGAVKDRLDEAWQSLKLKLVRAFSIGFAPIDEPEQIKGTWSFRYPTWEWLELSLVTIPANTEATISVVKSLDAQLLAASDRRKGIVRLDDDIVRRARCQQHPGAIFLDQPRRFKR